MGVRVKEDGESESRLVMGRIGVALNGKITPRESGQTSIRSFPTREPELPTLWDKAVDSSGNTGWCGPPRKDRLDDHRLANSQSERASAPGAYRERSEPRPKKPYECPPSSM